MSHFVDKECTDRCFLPIMYDVFLSPVVGPMWDVNTGKRVLKSYHWAKAVTTLVQYCTS